MLQKFPLRFGVLSCRLAGLVLAFAVATYGQNIPTITTVAGGLPINNGLATNSVTSAGSVATDTSGNFFILDFAHHMVRKVDSSGVISTVVGNGTPGFSGDGGPAVDAEISLPEGLVADTHGNLFFADFQTNSVRKVDSGGIITTVAGNGAAGFSGDGGPATSASLNSPTDLAIDSAGNLFVVDSGNFRIRKIDTSGVITTVAGSTRGFSGDGGPAINAQFLFMDGIAVDSLGEIFISDAGNERVRKIDTSGNINTIAGTGVAGGTGDGGPAINATLNNPGGLALDSSGNLLIADSANGRVRKIDTQGVISTVAGNGTAGFSGDGGAATNAELFGPGDVAVDSLGNLYISDAGNNRIRRVDSQGIITTVAGTGEVFFAGDGGPATSALLQTAQGVAADGAGNIFISDTENLRIRKVNSSGIISSVVVGQTVNGLPTLFPLGLFTDPSGNLFFANLVFNGGINELLTTGSVVPVGSVLFRSAVDVAVTQQGIWTTDDNCIEKLNAGVEGNLTVAGMCGPAFQTFGGDGGPATSANLNLPGGVAVDDAGNIFIADSANNRVRKVDTNGIINTIAGNGIAGFSGDGGPALSATISNPLGIRLGPGGNLYFADVGNERIRKIDPTGIITTIAGNGTAGFSGDGGPATSASFNGPFRIALDRDGNLLVADALNNRIRKVTLPDFALVASPSSATVKAGQSATFVLSITPRNGFTGSIAFSCPSLPASASCAFSPSSVTPNGAPASVTLQVNTAAGTALLSPQLPLRPGQSPLRPFRSEYVLLGIVGIVFAAAGTAKRTRSRRTTLLSGAILGLMLFCGCGGGSSTSSAISATPTPTPAPSTTMAVTVLATATQGSIVNATTINLTVTQ